MSVICDIDLHEWEVVDNTTLASWVVNEYRNHLSEPLAIHASVYDGNIPRWVIIDYLVESL